MTITTTNSAIDFDSGPWMTQLLKLNPWADEVIYSSLSENDDGDHIYLWGDYDTLESSDAFHEARKQASRSRFREGRDAWNSWAQKMLTLKTELVENKKWSLQFEQDGSEKVGANPETRTWRSLARSDFSNVTFPANDWPSGDFELYNFPGDADFSHAKFECPATFLTCTFHGKADYGRAIFGQVLFQETKCLEDASFDAATFTMHTSFIASEFSIEASFYHAKFAHGAEFEYVKFCGTAKFRDAVFDGDAGFLGAAFFMAANFERVTFGRGAIFSQSGFGGAVSFEGARFRDRTEFASIQNPKGGGIVAFSLIDAEFAFVPNFDQADFKQPPRLDSVHIHEQLDTAHWPVVVDHVKRFYGELGKRKEKTRGGKERVGKTGDNGNDASLSTAGQGKREGRRPYLAGYLMRRMAVAATREATSRFRTLKRWAAVGHDHQNEIEFFAQETRTRRFWEDHPFGRGAGRFWFGWLYEKVSDFGRSLVRPFAAWLASTLLLAPLIYLWLAGWSAGTRSHAAPWSFVSRLLSLMPSDACLAPMGARYALESALQLSLNSAVLRFEWLRTDPGKIALGCLYGLTGDQNLAQMPLSVTAAVLVQNAVSVTLIFLFLLGLRNLLRLK